MSKSTDIIPEPDENEIPDEKAKRMSFTGHLGELRNRMIHTTVVLSILFMVGMSFSTHILTYIQDLVDIKLEEIIEEEGKEVPEAPVEPTTASEVVPVDIQINSADIQAMHDQLNGDDVGVVQLRIQVEDLKNLVEELMGDSQTQTLEDILEKKEKGLKWITLTPLEAFMVKLKIALYTAIALGLPYIVYQICAFVFPGLRPKEKFVVRFALMASFTLAIFGILTALYIVFPLVFPQLLKFAPEWVGTFLQLDKTMTFIFKVVLGFGLAFQFPIGILVAVYLDLVSPKVLREQRKIAIVVILIVAAILTPPDPATLFLMSAPLLVLYEISILLSFLIVKRRKDEDGEVA